MNFNGFDITVTGNWILRDNCTNAGLITFNGIGGQTVGIGSGSAVLPGDVVINTTSDVIFEADMQIEGSLDIQGTLDITANNNLLALTGNWNNDGTFTERGGTVTFNGSSLQIIQGSTSNRFRDLEIDNPAGASIAGAGVFVRRGLTTPSGSLAANGLLTMNSSAVEDAYIGQNASISGNLNVRRFLPPGSADYRDLCSPVVGTTIADWDDELIISGPSFPDGCAWGNGCFVSLATFNATTQRYVPATGPSDPLTNGVGFEIFIGDDLSTFGGTLVTVTGTNFSGSKGNFCRAGWNLLGNPFPSAVDFDLFSRGAGIGNYFYIYDASTGNFEYYDGSSSTSSGGSIDANGLMSSSQGFWVYSTAGIATLTIPESSKVTSTPGFVRRPYDTQHGFALNLTGNMNQKSCRSMLVLSDDRLAAEGGDIVSFTPPAHPDKRLTAPMLTFLNELGEQTRKDIRYAEDELMLQLVTNIKIAGEYTITAEHIEAVSEYGCIEIIDTKTGVAHNLKEGAFTFANLGKGEDETRYILRLSNNGCTPPLDIASAENAIDTRTFGNTVTVMVDNYPNMEEGTLTVYNALGQVVMTPVKVLAEPNTYELFLPEGQHGMYLIVIDLPTERVTKKVVY